MNSFDKVFTQEEADSIADSIFNLIAEDDIDFEISNAKKKIARYKKLVKQLEDKIDETFVKMNKTWSEEAKKIIKQKRMIYVVYDDDYLWKVFFTEEEAEKCKKDEEDYFIRRNKKPPTIVKKMETAKQCHLKYLINHFEEKMVNPKIDKYDRYIEKLQTKSWNVRDMLRELYLKKADDIIKEKQIVYVVYEKDKVNVLFFTREESENYFDICKRCGIKNLKIKTEEAKDDYRYLLVVALGKDGRIL